MCYSLSIYFRKEGDCIIMKKFDFIPTLILSIVTCGIYALYVWYTMSENSNKIAEKCNVKKTSNFIWAVVIGMFTFGIFTLYWIYTYYVQQVAIAKANGVTVQPVTEPILLLILTCVPIFNYYILCDIHNKNVDAAAHLFA